MLHLIDKIIQDIEQQGLSFQQNVITPEKLSQLQVLYESDFLPAQVGKNNGRQRAEQTRGDWISWIDPLHPPHLLSDEIHFLNELKASFNKKFYLGIKDFECHLAKYPPGTFYKKHLDQFASDSSRVISFIFYLHRNWSEADGGELILYSKDNQVIKTMTPEPGSMICFLSADFPHEVKTCHQERFSLTGWMHTKILT